VIGPSATRFAGLRGALLLVGATLIALPGIAADPAGTRLAVAAFETSGPPGAEIPDVATLLADRIGALGVGRIVGPATLAAAPNASPPDVDVIAMADQVDVDAVVVGRTTRIGAMFSVDVHVRSGRSGKSIGTYVAEVANAAQLGSKVDRLAGQVVDGTTAHLVANAPKPVAARPPPSPKKKTVVKKRRPFDGNKPISIKSKTLEATDIDGRRRLVFTGDVRVKQDDVRMTSNTLTADYPSGESQPSLMVARGSVKVTQRDQMALCDTGTYKRSQEVLVCCGNAELRDGPNRVRGKCIEFDLNGEKVRVQDATINIFPEPKPPEAAEAESPIADRNQDGS
jgi:lipopolysaccharide transport protein LptA